ncbi:MAG: cation-translocating P-type ATPase [Candidatus Micrarchaeia archaeon]
MVMFKEKLQGLSDAEASKRLKEHGPNILEIAEEISPIKIFIDQFRSLFVLVLLAAAIISFAINETLDSIAIFAILILNSILGFIQEYRASKAIEALRKISVQYARVVRNGIIKVLDSKYIVPGDVILIEEGDKIPADCEVYESINLECDEAIITGESRPVKKEKGDAVYANTLVVRGRGTCIAKKTGLETQFGKIALLTTKTTKEEVPLEVELNKMSKRMTILILFIALTIFIISYFSEKSLIETFMFSVSLAVAAIPEGLPIVVTITLAIGVQRMARKNAIVKRMLAVQGLGSVDVICTDKTGTLTKNEMAIRKIWCDGLEYDVTGSGYSDKGTLMIKNMPVIPSKQTANMLKYAMLCTTGQIEDVEKPIGDPTEISILYAAKKIGLSKKDALKDMPLIVEFGFDSSLKRMTTVHQDGKNYLICTKGAVESLLGICNRVLINGKIYRLDKKKEKEILQKMEEYANNAYRVIGVAYGIKQKSSKASREETEKNLVFMGMLAMYDAPREEVYAAIDACKKANIDVKMLTGDYEKTAIAIAKEIGLLSNEDNDFERFCLNGEQISNLTDDELAEKVKEVKIFSRVSPDQKMRVLKALKRNNKIVAMTGDGVNDAPSLKLADIGIAMGIMGTDVARESGDIVLMDDNFATIVEAVKEGRTIMNNIMKFVYYLISANFSELIIITGIILFAELSTLNSTGEFLLPLLPLHILWINLLTDGLPAIALGVDPVEKNLAKNNGKRKELLSFRSIIELAIISLIISLPAFGLFFVSRENGYSTQLIRTILFTYIVVSELALVFIIRTRGFSVIKLFTNKYLVLAVLVSLLLHLYILYSPANEIMKVTPLLAENWQMILIGVLLVMILLESIKLALPNKSEILLTIE